MLWSVRAWGGGFTQTGMKCESCEQSIEANETAGAKVLGCKCLCLKNSQEPMWLERSGGWEEAYKKG